MTPEPTTFALDEAALKAALLEKSPGSFTEEERQAVEPDQTPEPVETPEEGTEPAPVEEPAPTLEESMSEAVAPDADKVAADAKAAADAEAAKKSAAAAPVAPVHQDLEDEVKKLDPHTKPKTRQLIETFKQKTITERQRATKAEADRAELQKKYDEAQAQLTSGKPPKAVEEELNTLRERVRELDVSKDPQIEAKYDKPIGSNAEAAINLLGEHGLFSVRLPDVDGKPQLRAMTDKEKADTVARMKATGVSIKTMAQSIKLLEGAGEVEAAEQLRELARENDRLAREKNNEITSAKANYEGRAQARTQEQQKANEQITEIVSRTSQSQMASDLAELAKAFPQINRPDDPLPTDAAAVVASKKAAQAEFDAASKQVEEASQVFSEAGLPPPKAAEARGRMVAAAVQSVILKNHVLPRMTKDIAAKDARIKELQAQVDGFRKAGGLNRAHAASITASSPKPAGDVPANASFTDALKAQMKAAGVDINS